MELVIALVLMSVGILALARMLPASAHSTLQARLQDTAGQYANEEFESLRGLARNSTSLSVGRHPASGYDSLGTLRSWRRYYVVSAMAAPIDSLLKVKSTVLWTSSKPESVRIVGYLMP